MDKHSIKVLTGISVLFTLEIFATGYLSVLWDVGSTKELLHHFAYSLERYIEVAFFHMMPMGVTLFIYLHLLPILQIKRNISVDVLILFTLLFLSQIGWFVLHAPVLKILSSFALFGVTVYEMGLLIKRLYTLRAQ